MIRSAPRLILVAASLSGLIGVCAPVALAQSSMPCEVVEDPAPSAADRQRIEDRGASLAEAIASGEPRAVEEARELFIRPFLACDEPSVAFRQAYGRSAIADLATAALGDDVHRSINALVVLGFLASAESVDTLLEALEDDRPGVRLAAASAIADTIQGDTRDPGLRRQAVRCLDGIRERFDEEDDPAVAAALITSLSVDQSRPEVLRQSAGVLAEVLPERIGTLEDEIDALVWSKSLGRASATLRASTINANTSDPQEASRVRQTTRASAATLGFVARVCEAHPDLAEVVGTPLADALETLVTSATSQIGLAATQLSNQPVSLPDLSGALERALDSGDPARYRDALEALGEALDRIGVGADAIDPRP